MGAADDVVSQELLFIDGPMGNFQLRKVKSWDIDDESDAEGVTAGGVSGFAGIKYKEGGVSISLDVFKEKGTPEVDYDKVKRLKQRFSLTTQAVEGQRKQYQQCIVAKVSRKDDDQGGHTFTVKIIGMRPPTDLAPKAPA